MLFIYLYSREKTAFDTYKFILNHAKILFTNFTYCDSMRVTRKAKYPKGCDAKL